MMRCAAILLALGGAHAIRLGAVVPSSRAVMRCRAPVMDAVSEMPVSLDALSEIQQTVAGQAVVLFSKSRCAESNQCKSILDSMEQPYTTMDLDLSDDGEAFEAALLSLTQRALPNVFVGGQLLRTVTPTLSLKPSPTLTTSRWAAPRWDCRDAGGGGPRLAVRASRGLRRGADGVRRAHARAALGRCRGVMEW